MILIAEDNENDAKAILECLKKAGVKDPVVVVEDGKEVVAYFKGQDKYADRTKYPLPRILLLDVKMPQLGGFEVMEWLRLHKLGKDVLIVILSGYQLSDIRQGYELGARSFLPKPCSVDDILNLIRAYPAYWQMGTGASKGGLARMPLSS